MARQSTTPVSFSHSVRADRNVTMSSARAGVVAPVDYFPLLAGDSASGRVGVDIKLAPMPKPLLNAVTANIQAWFVPKLALPQFSSREELVHAMTGTPIKALGADDRTPPPYFNVLSGTARNEVLASEMFTGLGIHCAFSDSINTDLIDAFNVVYNFRLAAISSRLPRRSYAIEDHVEATTLPPAFWPSAPRINMVPDYERALVVGSLDLDVIAGRVPVNGIGGAGAGLTGQTQQYTFVDGLRPSATGNLWSSSSFILEKGADGLPALYGDLAGQTIGVSLADIDKARTTQAFAKLRTAYAGNDATGFDNDDAIIAVLMQGIGVGADEFKRPWLLDSKRVPVNFAERFSTDADALDVSNSDGLASAMLSINVPKNDVGGVVIVTVEVMPERIDERQADYWLSCTEYNDLPNALRDVQRPEPVDMVLNKRIDAKHAAPNQLYGYEPMNNVWNRDFTRLGGNFYQAAPGSAFTENRAAIWGAEMVNPNFSSSHYLAPYPFPHDVFADTTADAFECVARHDVKIVGLTQIGDVLAENSDDYDAVEAAGTEE